MRATSLLPAASAALWLSALAPLHASAQRYFTVTPTYQASSRRWDAVSTRPSASL
jgi:hypothetical protein